METNDPISIPEDGTINKLDELVAKGTQAVAVVTMSRRGFLAWAAKSLFALAGATLIPALPIDREFPVAESAAPDCNAWYNCYMAADRTCACACGSNNCPSGTSTGSGSGAYWTACCYNGVYIRVYYYDCCGKTTGCCAQSGCGCQRPPGHTEPYWCGGVPGGYCCTMVATGGFC